MAPGKAVRDIGFAVGQVCETAARAGVGRLPLLSCKLRTECSKADCHCLRSNAEMRRRVNMLVNGSAAKLSMGRVFVGLMAGSVLLRVLKDSHVT